MEKQLKLDPARLDDIEQVHDFVDALCRAVGVDDDTNFAIKLSVEEAYNNIVMHGYGDNPGPVTLYYKVGNGVIQVSLQDQAPRFSPDQVPAPDLEGALEERRIGGLGWHLIRQMMDEVHHEFVAGGNLLILVKKIPAQSNRSKDR